MTEFGIVCIACVGAGVGDEGGRAEGSEVRSPDGTGVRPAWVVGEPEPVGADDDAVREDHRGRSVGLKFDGSSEMDRMG